MKNDATDLKAALAAQFRLAMPVERHVAACLARMEELK